MTQRKRAGKRHRTKQLNNEAKGGNPLKSTTHKRAALLALWGTHSSLAGYERERERETEREREFSSVVSVRTIKHATVRLVYPCPCASVCVCVYVCVSV